LQKNKALLIPNLAKVFELWQVEFFIKPLLIEKDNSKSSFSIKI
jgi:hypothetical protein